MVCRYLIAHGLYLPRSLAFLSDSFTISLSFLPPFSSLLLSFGNFSYSCLLPPPFLPFLAWQRAQIAHRAFSNPRRPGSGSPAATRVGKTTGSRPPSVSATFGPTRISSRRPQLSSSGRSLGTTRGLAHAPASPRRLGEPHRPRRQRTNTRSAGRLGPPWRFLVSRRRASSRPWLFVAADAV